MMKGVKVSFVFLFLVLLSAFLSASCVINERYSPGEAISGRASFNFTGDVTSPVTLRVSDSNTKSIRLIELIDIVALSNKCQPVGCVDDYSTIGEKTTSRNFSLSSDKLIGVIVSGNNLNVKGFKFNLESNVESSCSNQLSINVLNDGRVNWVNPSFLSENCGQEIKSSCNDGNYALTGGITPDPYCEKLSLPSAPAFTISARIQNTGTFTSGDLKGLLYDSTGKELSRCDLSNPSSDRSTCLMNFTNTKTGDYYVCVALAPGASSSNYRIFVKENANCGLRGIPGLGSLSSSYDITAYARKFGEVGSFVFNDSSFALMNDASLVSYVDGYISQMYLRNCTNCVIPLNFSGVNQDIRISDLELTYDSAGVSSVIQKEFYEVQKIPAKINSSIQIDLSKIGFGINQEGNYTLEFFVGNEKICSRNISVSETGIIARFLYPRFVAAANPTNFIILSSPVYDLSNYTFRWKFGDGGTTTGTNKVRHTYAEIGKYDLEVEVLQNNVVVDSKIFEVQVQSPKDTINSTIDLYNQRIVKIEKFINTLPYYQKEVFLERVDISELKNSVSVIDSSYRQKVLNDNTPDADYVELMQQLVALDIPSDIVPVFYGRDVSLFVDSNNVDVTIIENLFNDYSGNDKDIYADAISSWVNEKNIKFDQKVLSIFYDDRVEDVLTIYDVKIGSVGTDNGYFIINSGNVILDPSYQKVSSPGVTAFSIDLTQSKIYNFALAGKYDVYDVTFFVTPKLNQIKVGGNLINVEPRRGFWMVIVSFILLIVVGIAIYSFAERWYKNNYEKSLFKDRNDLFNLIYFIKNAKAKKLTEVQIREKLKTTKWKGEQITYALKKEAGKPTGMWELPFFKWKDKREMDKEMEKRKKRVI